MRRKPIIKKHQFFLLLFLWGVVNPAFSATKFENPTVVFDVTREKGQVYALTHVYTLQQKKCAKYFLVNSALSWEEAHLDKREIAKLLPECTSDRWIATKGKVLTVYVYYPEPCAEPEVTFKEVARRTELEKNILAILKQGKNIEAGVHTTGNKREVRPRNNAGCLDHYC